MQQNKYVLKTVKNLKVFKYLVYKCFMAMIFPHRN